MWHASVSIQAGPGQFVVAPARIEQAAIDALRGVGGDREWWCLPTTIGHLRVPVTTDEVVLLPPGCARFDAGETGPERPRTYR